MGNELVSGSDSLDDGGRHKSSPTSYIECFYEHFPYYLAMGMTYDQFWNDDPCLCRYYRKAHEIKRKMRNEELWLQGMYIYEVLCDVNPIFQAFPQKGAKPTPYSTEPYALTDEEQEERKERDNRLKYESMKNKMENYKNKFNKGV